MLIHLRCNGLGFFGNLTCFFTVHRLGRERELTEGIGGVQWPGNWRKMVEENCGFRFATESKFLSAQRPPELTI